MYKLTGGYCVDRSAGDTHGLGGLFGVLEAAGVGRLTRNFIGVVTRNRRLFGLPGMIKDYQALLAAARGEATAVASTPSTRSQIPRSSTTFLNTLHVNPSVSVWLASL